MLNKKIKKDKQILFCLLFLSPALGELLSGSSPPLEFFNPFTLLFLVLLYGCGTILIREAKARWKLQWSVIFLAVAYGIIEEGLMVKSFFNPGWVDMESLSGYGMYFGVQWVWTIMLTFYHATISTLIPILIVELLWPSYKNVPLLKKRGLSINLAGITFVTIFGMIFMGTDQGGQMIPYYPHPLLLIGSFVVVALLIWLSYKFKNSRISIEGVPLFSPLIFGVAGFLFQSFNLIIPNILAKNNVHFIVTLLIQFILIGSVSIFAAYQVYNRNITKHHIVSVIFGSILFFVLLTPVIEFNNGAYGMLAVGIISLVLLIIWRHIVLKINNK